MNIIKFEANLSAMREAKYRRPHIDIVKERGSRSLLAGMCAGRIGFGEVDWSEDKPTGHGIASAKQLASWQ